jgi:hypothetical protein
MPLRKLHSQRVETMETVPKVSSYFDLLATVVDTLDVHLSDNFPPVAP